MTTIAWDGQWLSGDQLSTGHLNPVVKIRRLADGSLVGGTGDTGWLARVYEWMEAGFDPLTRPSPPADSIKVLRIVKKRWHEAAKVTVYTDTLVPVPVNLPFYAIGSGSQYAMAAMHCGKNAAEAVGVAMVYDYQTGGSIDTLTPEYEDATATTEDIGVPQN